MRPPLRSFNPYTFDPDADSPTKGVKVAFGSFTRLYSEDSLRSALGVPLSRKAFRALLRVLSVPTISIGKTRLVDGFSFFLALRAVLRIGQPNFYAPGSHDKKLHLEGRPTHASASTTLSLPYLSRNYRSIVMELLAAQRSNRLRVSDKALVAATNLALERMVALGFQHAPLRSQSRVANAELRRLTTDGTLPPWTLDDASFSPPIEEPTFPASPPDPATG